MNNIFENAYFGKAYKTMDGRKALYVGKAYGLGIYVYLLVIEGSDDLDEFTQDGSFNVGSEHPFDIISEWKEEINEEELDKLAEHEYPYEYYTSLYGEEEAEYKDDLREAFKAGYRKSIENKKII